MRERSTVLKACPNQATYNPTNTDQTKTSIPNSNVISKCEPIRANMPSGVVLTMKPSDPRITPFTSANTCENNALSAGIKVHPTAKIAT